MKYYLKNRTGLHIFRTFNQYHFALRNTTLPILAHGPYLGA